MTTSTPSQDPSAVIFTPSERIKQLNEIDKVPTPPFLSSPLHQSINRIPRAQDLSHLLHSAGAAIEALTLPPSSPSSAEEDSPNEKFRNTAAQYFSLLSSIDVRLRRQIYALEEADILSPSSSAVEKVELQLPGSQGSTSALGSSQGTTAASGGKGGVGMGVLDVGWLNSRNDSVGKEMEAELWRELEGLVEGLEKKVGRDGAGG